MDLISWIVLGGITVVNIAGWIYTRVYTYGKRYGKLEERVKNLDDIINNGLVQQVSEMQATIARMDGTLNTFIELTKRRFGGDK